MSQQIRTIFRLSTPYIPVLTLSTPRSRRAPIIALRHLTLTLTCPSRPRFQTTWLPLPPPSRRDLRSSALLPAWSDPRRTAAGRQGPLQPASLPEQCGPRMTGPRLQRQSPGGVMLRSHGYKALSLTIILCSPEHQQGTKRDLRTLWQVFAHLGPSGTLPRTKMTPLSPERSLTLCILHGLLPVPSCAGGRQDRMVRPLNPFCCPIPCHLKRIPLDQRRGRARVVKRISPLPLGPRSGSCFASIRA